MNLELKAVGQRINQHRRQQLLSLDKLAAAVGTTKSNLSRVENARQNVTVAMLLRIAAALKVKPYQFFQ